MSEASGAKRGKKAISFSKLDVQAKIYEIEKDGPLGNLGQLWTALAAKYGVSTATVIKWANGLEIKTQPGKRGGEGGDFGRSRGIRPDKSNRKPRKGMSEIVAANIIDNLPSYANTQVRAKVAMLAEKAVAGNTKAASQLKCLGCANYQANEVRLCTSGDVCEIFHLRPYKGKAKAEDEESGSFATEELVTS